MPAAEPLTRKVCVVCSSPEKISYYQDSHCEVARCAGCGLVYTTRSDLMSVEPIDLYTEKYYQSNDPVFGYEDYIGAQKDFSRSFQSRLKMIEKLAIGRKILDLGCAHGFFLREAKKQGWESYGLDVSEPAVAYGRKEFGLELYRAKVEEYEGFQAESFDCVTLWDLIEQVPDSNPIFKKVYSLLKPKGLVVLTIRDIDSLMSKALKHKWIHFRPREKFVYYSRKTIRRMLEKHGFKVIRITSQGGGKWCTLEILCKKLRHYSPRLADVLYSVVAKLRLQDRSVCLNFFDTSLVFAQK